MTYQHTACYDSTPSCNAQYTMYIQCLRYVSRVLTCMIYLCMDMYVCTYVCMRIARENIIGGKHASVLGSSPSWYQGCAGACVCVCVCVCGWLSVALSLCGCGCTREGMKREDVRVWGREPVSLPHTCVCVLCVCVCVRVCACKPMPLQRVCVKWPESYVKKALLQECLCVCERAKATATQIPWNCTFLQKISCNRVLLTCLCVLRLVWHVVTI